MTGFGHRCSGHRNWHLDRWGAVGRRVGQIKTFDGLAGYGSGNGARGLLVLGITKCRACSFSSRFSASQRRAEGQDSQRTVVHNSNN